MTQAAARAKLGIGAASTFWTDASGNAGPAIQTGGPRLRAIIGVGQSNMMNGGDLTRGLSSLRFAPYPNLLLCPENPRYGTVQGDDAEGAFSRTGIARLTALRDRDQPAYQYVADQIALMDLQVQLGRTPNALLCFAAGEGSEAINSFLASDMTGYTAGKLNYANLLEGVRCLVALAANHNLGVDVDIEWCQGEGKIVSPYTVSDYQAVLTLLSDRWGTDIPAITGQTKPVIVYVRQTALSSGTIAAGLSNTLQASAVVQALQATCRARPDRFRMATPMYGATLNGSSASAHPSEDGRKFIAGAMAEALLYGSVDGGTWNPLQISAIRATNVANTVRVFFDLPPGTTDIAVDTDRVLTLTGAGFKIVSNALDGTAGAVSVVAATKVAGIPAVDLTLSGAYNTSATDYIEYALTTGAGSSQYDSRGLIYAASNNRNPYRARYDAGKAGGAAITPEIRHYAIAERFPVSVVTDRLGTQRRPTLDAAIAGHAALSWWGSAGSLDTTVSGSNITEWKTRRASDAGTVVFSQATSARQAAYSAGALLGTERSALFTAAGIAKYSLQGSQPSMSAAWTFAALCRVTSGSTATGYLFGVHATGGSSAVGTGLYAYDNGGRSMLALKHGGTSDIALASNTPRGEWMFVVASHDGAGRLRLQVNGADVATATVPAADLTVGTPALSSAVFCLGAQCSTTNNFPFDGDVRDHWFYAGVDLLAGSPTTRGARLTDLLNNASQVNNISVAQTPAAASLALPNLTGTTIITSTQTWTKRAGTKMVGVLVVGGGGAGGFGGTYAPGTTGGSGGGGGGGAGYDFKWFRADDLPSSVLVTIGAGGVGGQSGVTPTGGTIAGQGGRGGITSFGNYAYGGGGGGGAPGALGSASGGGGSAAAVNNQAAFGTNLAGGSGTYFGATGGYANAGSGPGTAGIGSSGGGTSAIGAAFAGGNAQIAPVGGGSGGGYNASGVAQAGAVSGITNIDGAASSSSSTAGAVSTAGGAGATPTVLPLGPYFPSRGGGGGGAGSGANGGAGGAGGLGAGGGGGGAGNSAGGFVGGVGGNGGNGYCVIVEI